MGCSVGRLISREHGFTLLELLVAMAILAVIVVAVSQLYQQSSVAWDSGWRRAESMMIGRTLADFIAREAAHAVWDSSTGAPQGADYYTLRGTNGLQRVLYQVSGGLKRATEDVVTKAKSEAYLIEDTAGQMEVKEFSLDFLPAGNPAFANVYLKIMTKDKNRTEEKVFTASTPLLNRGRYRYE